MKVSASLDEEYLFIPDWGELYAMSRVFSGLVNATGQGWTLKAYDAIQSVLIKDSIYFDATCEKTRHFKNRQLALTSLKLAPSLSDGSILDASKGLVSSYEYKITNDKLGYIANHVPQLLMRDPSDSSRVITAIAGEYNFKSRLFKGLIVFKPLSEVWSE
ncbi:TPA: hypothetical protein P0E12_004955 [Vibrio harveyi]|nr:hypothetical protein [Vibrio harveyi]